MTFDNLGKTAKITALKKKDDKLALYAFYKLKQAKNRGQ
jgi:hypothetical protein